MRAAGRLFMRARRCKPASALNSSNAASALSRAAKPECRSIAGYQLEIQITAAGFGGSEAASFGGCHELEHGPDASSQQRALPRILVIEDEPLLAMDMAGMLSDAGFEAVSPASSLGEAMQAAAKRDFDAVVLDANLAGKPVDELAALLTRANVPFAFVTGYGREGLPKAFASAPMLAKPFSVEAFIATVRKLISPEKRALALRRDERG